MVLYGTNVKHTKNVLYINELHMKRESFYELNNLEKVFVFYKNVPEMFVF